MCHVLEGISLLALPPPLPLSPMILAVPPVAQSDSASREHSLRDSCSKKGGNSSHHNSSSYRSNSSHPKMSSSSSNCSKTSSSISSHPKTSRKSNHPRHHLVAATLPARCLHLTSAHPEAVMLDLMQLGNLPHLPAAPAHGISQLAATS